MATKRIRVAVTGAAGQIGYALLFRIASGQMFGPDIQVDLNLLELPVAQDALKGVVMELDDCAFPLLQSITATDDVNVAFKDVDWALLVGSVPRKVGMERSDLLKVNGAIFITQGQALSNVAKPTCKVLVVGNPCNTNAFIAKSVAKNIPGKNFFALTMLDQNRAYAQLAQKAGVSVVGVENCAIWGNHSATQYPDFYQASIDGKSVVEATGDEAWLQTNFIETVQKRGAAIIKARGLSSAASAANAVIDTVRQLITPTPQGSYFSVAVCSDGSYGIDEGLIFGYPVQSDGQDWAIVQGLTHNDFAQQKIDVTHQELRDERAAVSALIEAA